MITRGNSAENIDEDRANLIIAKDDIQALSHNLCRGTATDIQEVRGLYSPLFTGQGNNVQGGHNQAGTVTDHADLAFQAHVVQSGFLCHGLARILRRLIGKSCVFGVTEGRIVVQRHLAIQRQNIALLGQDQGVDLNQGGVFASVGIPKLYQNGGKLLDVRTVEAGLAQDLGGNVFIDADLGVQANAGQSLGMLARQGFNIHAALRRAQCKFAALGAVQQDREVELFGDIRARSNEDRVDGVSLDIHAQNCFGLFARFFCAASQLYATGLAAAADLDLGLDHQKIVVGQQLLRCLVGLIWGACNDSRKYGDAVSSE